MYSILACDRQRRPWQNGIAAWGLLQQGMRLPALMVAKRMVHGRTWIGLVLLAGILMPTTALAHHRPNRHCSESGDVCAGTMKYRNCGDYGSGWPLNTSPGIVCESRAPDGTRSCKSLRIRKTGSTYGDSVRWRRNFPDNGPALTKYAGEQVASAAHYLASTSRGDGLCGKPWLIAPGSRRGPVSLS